MPHLVHHGGDEIEVARLNPVGAIKVIKPRRTIAGIEQDRIQVENDVGVAEFVRVVLRGHQIQEGGIEVQRLGVRVRQPDLIGDGKWVVGVVRQGVIQRGEIRQQRQYRLIRPPVVDHRLADNVIVDVRKLGQRATEVAIAGVRQFKVEGHGDRIFHQSFPDSRRFLDRSP